MGTTRTVISLSDGANEYKWNARNQLIEVSGGTTASFVYDPFGRRVSKTLAGGTTKLLYDGANAVQETKGSATVNLITGLSPDKTLARTTSSGTESFLTDALGSTIALAGSSGKAETNYTYDPFGNTTKEGTASENSFQYTGRENDGNGLYYNRARYYSPVSTRFISQDPLGQEPNGPNVYLYGANSPTNAVDPYGTNLKAPDPGPGGPTGPASAEGGSPGGGGARGASGGPGAAPGGFGPGPSPGGPGSSSCSPGTKGPGLSEAVRCKDYEKIEEAEEEHRRERESEEPRINHWEVLEEGIKRLVPIIKGCAAGATYGAYEGAFFARPDVGAAIGCGAGAVAAAGVETNPFP